jgi:phage/plasmid-associated DNA primase
LSEEDAEVYWKYVGLCLLKRNLTRRILIIHSEQSGTSKSPLTDIAGSLVGNSIELRTDHLDGRFETHRLIGRSMLIGPDVAGDFLTKKGAHVLLRLTGGDLITPEGKFDKSKMTKSIKGRFCVMISSNHHLRVSEGTVVDPWRRRLIILQSLGNKVKKEIDGYAEILLRKEGVGILNRAIEGLRSLLRDIEDGDAFRLSATQKNRVETLLSSSNTGQQFVRECLETGGNVTTAELDEAYFNLCREKGWQPRSDSRSVIKQTIAQVFSLNEQHSITRNNKDQKGYRGIQLKEQYRQELGQKGRLFENL